MNLEQKFDKSLKNNWFILFETLHPDGDSYDGVVTHNKSDFIALREEKDFELDGIVIIPKKFIKKIRDGKFEKCGNAIIRQNGEIEKISAPDWIEACENVGQLIKALKRKGIWAAVEIVFDDQTASAYYIGPITRAGARDFDIRCYDAAGQWEKEYTISYDEVFRIEIDSKYSNHFNRYMKSKDGNGKIKKPSIAGRD